MLLQVIFLTRLLCLLALAASFAAQAAPVVIGTNPAPVAAATQAPAAAVPVTPAAAAVAQPAAPVATPVPVPEPANATAASTALPAANGTAVTEAGPAAAATAAQGLSSNVPTTTGRLLQHNGQNIFLTGVNLGNVQFLPFEGNPYGYTAAEMRGILDANFADISATGANSVRFWLHIDGSQSPSWGNQVRPASCARRAMIPYTVWWHRLVVIPPSACAWL